MNNNKINRIVENKIITKYYYIPDNLIDEFKKCVHDEDSAINFIIEHDLYDDNFSQCESDIDDYIEQDVIAKIEIYKS